ncbi:hypothetical protein NQ317_003723 [Molorchus minor]|uniref:Uncharacterized protein n=1 Tax=Molorchus minor TaxID=1323400 RepID=A0ABQ9ISW5_9CUCU|nr:hypothetical protein NQ317_003723 [Molorchus minor]
MTAVIHEGDVCDTSRRKSTRLKFTERTEGKFSCILSFSLGLFQFSLHRSRHLESKLLQKCPDTKNTKTDSWLQSLI